MVSMDVSTISWIVGILILIAIYALSVAGGFFISMNFSSSAIWSVVILEIAQLLLFGLIWAVLFSTLLSSKAVFSGPIAVLYWFSGLVIAAPFVTFLSLLGLNGLIYKGILLLKS